MRVRALVGAAWAAADAWDDKCAVGAFDREVITFDPGHGHFDDQIVAFHERIKRGGKRERWHALRQRRNRSRERFQLGERTRDTCDELRPQTPAPPQQWPSTWDSPITAMSTHPPWSKPCGLLKPNWSVV
jgi:hypothetical protein